MPNLMSHLKKVAEQKPQATYYNVDMLKYQVWTERCVQISRLFSLSHRLHLCVSGVGRGHSVHPSEPGAELARRRRRHGPENRLQIQRGGHGGASSATRRPLPGSCRWRRSQSPSYGPARHLVTSAVPFIHLDGRGFANAEIFPSQEPRAADDTVEDLQPLS